MKIRIVMEKKEIIFYFNENKKKTIAFEYNIQPITFVLFYLGLMDTDFHFFFFCSSFQTILCSVVINLKRALKLQIRKKMKNTHSFRSTIYIQHCLSRTRTHTNKSLNKLNQGIFDFFS